MLIETSQTNEKEEIDQQRIYVYQQRIKSLNFAAVVIRSNIVFAIFKLIQFLIRFSSENLTATDRVIIYLYESRNLTIEYSNQSKFNVFQCANNATFANDEAIRKSSNNFFFNYIKVRLTDEQLNKSR